MTGGLRPAFYHISHGDTTMTNDQLACADMWASLTAANRWNDAKFLNGAAILLISAYTDTSKGQSGAYDSVRADMLEVVNIAVKHGFIDC